LVLDYEDLNDYRPLRLDPLLAAACEKPEFCLKWKDLRW